MDEETKKRISEIKEHETRLFPGEWRVEDYGGRVDIYDGPERIAIIDGEYPMPAAEFIAHARQDVPFLLDALEKAHAEIENLKTEINQMREDEGFPPPYSL